MNALVLEGGGVKGAYQIGAYYALIDNKIKIDGFFGTSIGAFNAALLCAKKEKELLHFWMNINPGKVFGFDEKMIEKINNDVFDRKLITLSLKTLFKVLRNQGIDTKPLLDLFEEMVSEEEIRKSCNDFGLVTVKFPKLKVVEIDKKQIPQGKLKEYVMASCYLPIFKLNRIIDDSYYFDGGFYDCCPINMAIDRKYDTIYAVKIKGIGLHQKVKNNNSKIITIEPRRRNGSVLELKHKNIIDNIRMGYYDTLREIKQYDGYYYVFKNKKDRYYNLLVRKISKQEIRRVMNFFNVNTNKMAVISSLEYIMTKEKISYYDVYKIPKMLRRLRRIKEEHFIYKFVNKLHIW